jgi:hypothetical protein
MTQHPGARGRRRDDHLGVREHAREAARQRSALAGVARVHVQLPAAGLLERELDLAPQPLQQSHHGTPGLREERVVEAGDKEGYAHARLQHFGFPFSESGNRDRIAAANSSGGVLGKMISPQNLAIGAAAVGMAGQEGDLFRKVLKWSVLLVLVMCVLVYLQSTPVLDWMVVK